MEMNFAALEGLNRGKIVASGRLCSGSFIRYGSHLRGTLKLNLARSAGKSGG
jgi:hypothetical protein